MNRHYLKWFLSAVDRIAKLFKLESAPGRTLLAFELVAACFFVLCIGLFLLHDLLLLLTSLLGGDREYHAFEVFLTAVGLMALSLVGIALREVLSRERMDPPDEAK